jgi:hypothetical protein
MNLAAPVSVLGSPSTTDSLVQRIDIAPVALSKCPDHATTALHPASSQFTDQVITRLIELNQPAIGCSFPFAAQPGLELVVTKCPASWPVCWSTDVIVSTEPFGLFQLTGTNVTSAAPAPCEANTSVKARLDAADFFTTVPHQNLSGG